MCLCWMSSNSRLLLFGCSGINSLLRCSVCMYICSNGSSRCGLLTGFISDIVSLILPYSCLLLSICSAYADLGSLFFMYRVCSWYLALRLRLVCPIYALWHALHVILYIPLFSYSGMEVCFFCFMYCCVVVVLNAMFILVFLNKLVIVLIFGAMIGESGPDFVVFLIRVLVCFLLYSVEFLEQLLWYVVVFCYCLYCLPFFLFLFWIYGKRVHSGKVISIGCHFLFYGVV